MPLRFRRVVRMVASCARMSIVLALGCCLVSGSAGADDPILLRVKVFPTAKILPMFVGNGFQRSHKSDGS